MFLVLGQQGVIVEQAVENDLRGLFQHVWGERFIFYYHFSQPLYAFITVSLAHGPMGYFSLELGFQFHFLCDLPLLEVGK